MSPGSVMTVAGPIAPDDVGIALLHEHLLADSTCWLDLAGEDVDNFADEIVTSENWPEVRRRSCANRDNLTLDDAELAARELREFLALGGRTVVDVTSIGMRRDPAGLRSIAAATGAHIVMGSGLYCEISHPEWVRESAVEDLAEWIERDVVEGVDGVRAGIIGEIGVNGQLRGTGRRVGEITPDEAKSLRAAARASTRTGAPLSVHLPNRMGAVAPTLAILADEDVPPDRVILGHMSSVPDFALHLDALNRGYWIAYDDFGMELENPWFKDTGDDQRMAWLTEAFDRGFGHRMLVSQDVWCRVGLRAFGGNGYAHILETIVPALHARGFEERDVRTLLVTNPAEVLAFR
jgi:phosphotriesterase-related protein